MEKIRLGRSNLMVSRSGFGAIPIQRIGFEEAKQLLQKAYQNGINFYDTARAYTDSEEKIGYALSDVRKDIIIATKTKTGDRKMIFSNIETSLRNLKTDYIDIYQLHNPATLPDPNEPNGAYQALLEAKTKGIIRFIGITHHRLASALQAAASGLYDTVQFPLSYLSSDDDLKLIAECRQKDIGVIAMKALSGGLITNAAVAFAFLRQFDNVVPIWGIQREVELNDFIALEQSSPALDKAMWQIINKDRAELSGSFCRACGYCLPCPVGIPISTAARVSWLMKRMPHQPFLEDKIKQQMLLIEDCQECGRCKEQCPYGLDIPKLLKEQLAAYQKLCADLPPC